MKPKAITLFIAFILGAVTHGFAQSYDDDDIYFNPSKATKPKKETKKTTYQQPNAVIYYPVADYPAADTYVPTGGRDVSVDDYNRRGVFGDESSKTPVTDSILNSEFANTRRIERYYNPQIVSGSNDEELVQAYYAQPATVNIIVDDPWMSPYYSGYWGYPWRYSSWAWNSWNWGWGPSWSWSWGWSPSWGWGPAWSWGPSWGWGPAWGPSWGWAYGPSRPGAVGNYRPGTGFRPGSAAAGNYRPSASGSYRPGTSGYRPGNTNSGYRTGRGNVRGSNRSNSYSRPANTNSNSNYNSGYRPGSSRSSGSSWGGSTGGFRSGGGMGGSRGGGGGRGRH